MSRHKIILIISIFIFGSGYFCSIGAEELELIPQTEENGLPSGWKPYEFKKIPLHTVYLLTSENGHVVIKAESHHSASGLFKRLEILIPPD